MKNFYKTGIPRRVTPTYWLDDTHFQRTLLIKTPIRLLDYILIRISKVKIVNEKIELK